MVTDIIPKLPLPYYTDLLEFINDMCFVSCQIMNDDARRYDSRLKLIEWLTIKETKQYCIDNNMSLEKLYNSEFNLYLDLIKDFKKRNVNALLMAKEAYPPIIKPVHNKP